MTVGFVLRAVIAGALTVGTASMALADENSNGFTCCCTTTCTVNGAQLQATACTTNKCNYGQACVCGGGCTAGPNNNLPYATANCVDLTNL
jgi:hypothetical protein